MKAAADGGAGTAMLGDIRVLDLTTFLSGPFCTMILADLGAGVTKVEPRQGCQTRKTPPFIGGESAYFMSLNRGKQSLTLNLKSVQGRQILQRLAARADVLVENFRPGVMERLGLGYAALAEANPRLVYASISGFGNSGPLREKGAYDMVIQGYGGVMSITGYPGGEPVRVGYSVADLAAGLYGAIAITGALRVRDRTGRGQHLDIAMFDCQLALMENAIARYFATGQVPGPLGSRHPSIAPFQAFRSQSGYFTLTASTDEQFAGLCDALGIEGVKRDPRFGSKADRAANAEALADLLGRLFEGRPRDHWLELLDRRGIPCGPIQDVREAAESPQAAARGMIVEMDHPRAGKIRVAGSPIRASLSPAGAAAPPPLLGQHTDALLAGLGYGPEAIGSLREAGVV